MSKFSKEIAPFVNRELYKSSEAQASGDFSAAFTHLENAHVLGQESTYWHVKVHWLMFIWGMKQRDNKEIFGQIIRILGALALTAVSAVPLGNTGGSNVSPIAPMPIKPEHGDIIKRAKNA